jgi:hypothetical protein
MKAIFKLSNEQIAAATLLAVAAAKAAAAYGDLNCGIYAVESNQFVNHNQSVRLVGGTLVIDGERCALAFDGGFAAAKEVLNPGQKPVEYQTSDRRLRWDEMLVCFMLSNRATRAEKLDYLEDHPDRWQRSSW